MAIKIGQPAPDFSLYDNEKNKVTLSELKGKNVVLLFYPLAFTSVCTAELCQMRDSLTQFNDLDAAVYGISTDSLHVQNAFKKSLDLNFPLLSDFNKVVAPLYDSLYDSFSYEMKGVTKRSSFVIDKQGIIRHIEILDNPGNIPDFDAIRNCLKNINQ